MVPLLEILGGSISYLSQNGVLLKIGLFLLYIKKPKSHWSLLRACLGDFQVPESKKKQKKRYSNHVAFLVEGQNALI